MCQARKWIFKHRYFILFGIQNRQTISVVRMKVLLVSSDFQTLMTFDMVPFTGLEM